MTENMVSNDPAVGSRRNLDIFLGCRGYSRALPAKNAHFGLPEDYMRRMEQLNIRVA